LYYIFHDFKIITMTENYMISLKVNLKNQKAEGERHHWRLVTGVW